MKTFRTPKIMAIIACIALIVQPAISLFSQVQTPRYIAINANCHGFYEYLPQGYSSGSKTFPLLIFVHGIGELGNGGSQLPNVLRNGPPKLINEGVFPATFTVNGKEFSFIVISPQFIAWPSQPDMNTLIDYALAHYHVDTSRIYLTGLSMGGGAVWDYSGDTEFPYGKRLAAIVPISGASTPNLAKSRVIATDNLPVWALQNQNDPTVPSSNTIGYINFINQPPAPVPPAKMTIFPATGHDAWTKSYDPAFTEAGLNVYQWMLQFQTGIDVLLPIVLSDFEVSLGANRQVTIEWVTSMEQNNAFFTLERSADGIQFIELANIPAENLSTGSRYSFIDKTASAGANYYRLSQTDLDGKSVHLGVKEVNIENDAAENLLVFPNPAKGSIFLQWNNSQVGNLAIRIFNSGGSLVQAIQANKENSFWQQQIAVDALAPGVYHVEVAGTAISMVRNFIKN